MSGLRYFKRIDEGNHDFGGEATFFLEVDERGDAVRQVEIYPNGRVLYYSKEHPEDEWGALAVNVIDGDPEAWAEHAISREEFERVRQENVSPG